MLMYALSRGRNTGARKKSPSHWCSLCISIWSHVSFLGYTKHVFFQAQKECCNLKQADSTGVFVSRRQHGRGEGGGKEAEVEKRRVVAHLVFISFPCFLIVQAKAPFQPEAMTLLLWYFILEETGHSLSCVLVFWEPVVQGNWQGQVVLNAAFGTGEAFLRVPKIHLLH